MPISLVTYKLGSANPCLARWPPFSRSDLLVSYCADAGALALSRSSPYALPWDLEDVAT